MRVTKLFFRVICTDLKLKVRVFLIWCTVATATFYIKKDDHNLFADNEEFK